MFDDTLQQGLIWNASTYLKACKHSGKGVLLLLLLNSLSTEMKMLEIKRKIWLSKQYWWKEPPVLLFETKEKYIFSYLKRKSLESKVGMKIVLPLS